MTETKRICENESRKISCRSDEVLDIVRASYGRSSMIARCGWSWTGFCHASNSFHIVSDQCQHMRSCSLRASNDVFGDPCKGVPKYLKIEYNCIRAPTTRPEPEVSRSAGHTKPPTTNAQSGTAILEERTPSDYPATGFATTSFYTTESDDVTNSANYSTKFEQRDSATAGVGLDWKIITGVGVGGIITLLAVLALLVLHRYRRRRAGAQKHDTAEVRPNELYETSPAYAVASDVTSPNDQVAAYSTVSDVTNIVNGPEHSQNNVYSLATDTVRYEPTPGTMTENILYGRR